MWLYPKTVFSSAKISDDVFLVIDSKFDIAPFFFTKYVHISP